MANIVHVVSLLTLLAACVLSREITRMEDNDITQSPDGAGATPGLPADSGINEVEIGAQVEACKGKNKTIAQVEACIEKEKRRAQVKARKEKKKRRGQVEACKGKNKTEAQVEACKEIRAQLKELKRMRCRAIREKVYTLDHIPESHNHYLDVHKFDIFPKVLSVKKCDTSCSYCQTEGILSPDGLWKGPWKRGYVDFFTCQPTEPDMKNYTIRANDRHTGKEEYFRITLRNEKCECKQRP
ncbi:uncharacterized protein [Palaemon carinicauda]|uniref:uncharacterized protein n=1 Tax=Palaemon carinicauda TaxID=392227 RepID=UPI0035B57187